MALRLEVATLSGVTVTVNADREETMLNVVRAAQQAMADRIGDRIIRHLVTADARITNVGQAVFEAKLQDGETLQAVLMTADEQIDAIRGELLKKSCGKFWVNYKDHKGQYFVIETRTLRENPYSLFGEKRDYDYTAMLYHLPSWRPGDAPCLMREGGRGQELVLVGDDTVRVKSAKGGISYHTIEALLEHETFAGVSSACQLRCVEGRAPVRGHSRPHWPWPCTVLACGTLEFVRSSIGKLLYTPGS